MDYAEWFEEVDFDLGLDEEEEARVARLYTDGVSPRDAIHAIQDARLEFYLQGDPYDGDDYSAVAQRREHGVP